MSGIATAVIGSAAIGLYGAHEAGKSSEKGAELSADAQMAELEYLKEVDKLPREYREKALKQLSERALEPGGFTSQEERVGLAKESPIYAEIMGGAKAGEETILRHAGATGELRSGNVQEALAGFTSDLSRSALSTAYGEQLSEEQRQLEEKRALANLPSNATQIGQVTSGIGRTLGAGEIAQGQIFQQGMQNIGNTALTGLSLGIQAGKI